MHVNWSIIKILFIIFGISTLSLIQVLKIKLSDSDILNVYLKNEFTTAVPHINYNPSIFKKQHFNGILRAISG